MIIDYYYSPDEIEEGDVAEKMLTEAVVEEMKKTILFFKVTFKSDFFLLKQTFQRLSIVSSNKYQKIFSHLMIPFVSKMKK